MSLNQQSGSSHNEASEWDELEARSLVFAEIDGPQERLARKRNVGSSFRWKQVTVMITLAICAYMFSIREDVLTLVMFNIEIDSEITLKDKVGDLKRKVIEKKRDFDKLLEDDYGIYKEEVFKKEEVMKYFQSPSHLSVERFQRRIMIKILEAQLGTTGKRVEFNWAIAGHSAAAGHGNLFNQTYGYVLDQSARPIFEAMGITFFGKNYAMGGMKSAPESALCQSSIYGPELDVLSWDFGMTDGSRDGNLYNIWSQRAGSHPTMPIIISYGSIAAKQIHESVEKYGMSAFDAVSDAYKHPNNPRSKFPDSLSDDINVDDLPRPLQFYRCGDQVESGEPCGERLVKFDTVQACGNNPTGQVAWHNGWRDHLLKGRVAAAFLIENVMEVIHHLDNGQISRNHVEEEENDNEGRGDIEGKEDQNDTTPALSQEYLDYLYELEARDKASFIESKPPTVSHFEGDLKDHHDEFLRSKAVCRYAYVPSFSRYQGLITEDPQKLEYLGGGKFSYENEGENFKSRPSPTPDDGTQIHLVYDFPGDNNGACKYSDIDFKHYFNVRFEDEWTSTVVPNDSENDMFSDGEDWKERLGLVTICERFFAFGRFPSNYISIENMFNTTITREEDTIKVNGIKVTGVTRIGTINSFCYVLHHNGTYKFPPSEEYGIGRYEVKFRIPKRGSQLYLSSIIVI